jgi:cell division protein FtsQ
MTQGATRKSAPASRQESRVVVIGQRLLVLGCLSALLALVVFAGWQLSRLPIEKVAVTGDLARVSRERMESMVNEALQGGFIGADLQLIREPLEELPWVYRVTVKRRWPSTLEIRVKEQLPIARWGERGFLNHEGEVFVPDNAADVGELPRLEGPDGSQRLLMNHYKTIAQGLTPAHLQILSLSMDARGSVSVNLVSGGELIFGRTELDRKLERFLAIYRAELAGRSNQLARVDLRYEHGLSVAWADSVATTE